MSVCVYWGSQGENIKGFLKFKLNHKRYILKPECILSCYILDTLNNQKLAEALIAKCCLDVKW